MGGGGGGNHFHLQPVAELRRAQINVIRQLTTDHNLDLDVDFTEGGKPKNQEKNTNYNHSSHMISKFENQHRVIPRWSLIQL